MTASSRVRTVWAVIIAVIATLIPLRIAWSASTPDGLPRVRKNVKLPPIRGPKKNPNPVPTSRTVTLKNAGDATLNGLIGAPGNPQVFACSAGCGPFSLAPGKATTFTLSFGPASPGKYKDALTIATNSAKVPSRQVNMRGRAKQGVPGGLPGGGGGGGGGGLPPPLDGCQLPTTAATQPGGGLPSPSAATAEDLLNSLTGSSGSLPTLSQLTGSTAASQALDSIPVLGAITSTTGGTLSGLPLSGLPAPTLGSVVPDPSTIPVLGTMDSTPGAAAVCQEFNAVVGATGPCGQLVGVLLNIGSNPPSQSDVTTIQTDLSDFAANYVSAAGLSQILSNPSQISGFLTVAQTQLTAMATALDPQLVGAANQCIQQVPSICTQAASLVGEIESLAPATSSTVTPNLGQITGSLPNGGTLAGLPVVGTIVTGGSPQFLPVTGLGAPTLGTLTGNSSTIPSIPVLGEIPLNVGGTQTDALLAVASGSSVVGVVPVVGSTGSVPDPASIISSLQGGNPCSGFPAIENQVTQVLTSQSLGAPLPSQISGVPNLATALGTMTTGLEAVTPGLSGLL